MPLAVCILTEKYSHVGVSRVDVVSHVVYYLVHLGLVIGISQLDLGLIQVVLAPCQDTFEADH